MEQGDSNLKIKRQQFSDIVYFIKMSQNNAVMSVNIEMINLYWNIGKYVGMQLANSVWGSKTVAELADFIQKQHPEIKGFNRRGLYRMKQFYETYASSPIVSLPMTQLQITDNMNDMIVSTALTQFQFTDIRQTILAKTGWSQHLILMSRAKNREEREFYLNLCIKEKYTVRELDRQIDSGVFERVMLGQSKMSGKLQETYPDISNILKDKYIIEFTGLMDDHSERDLQKSLIAQMKNFILELGKEDFLFYGEEYQTKLPDKKLLQQKLREILEN